jgi:hypothetical protein
MTPRVWRGDVWEISASGGETHYVLAEVAGHGTTIVETLFGVVAPIVAPPDNLADYIEGTIDLDDDGAPIVTLRQNVWLAQLSAAGYTDQTELSVHDTREDAEAYLVETYDDIL